MTYEQQANRAFWGTLVIIAVIFIGLQTAAMLNTPRTQDDIASEPARKEDSLATQTDEMSGDELSGTLTDAQKVALAEVDAKIDDELGPVYAPVFEAIPDYAEFHYSWWGSYAEVTTAILAEGEKKLEGILFKGFDARAENAFHELDRAFNDSFAQTVSTTRTAHGPVGKATEAILDSAIAQTNATAVTAIGAIGGAKVASTVIAAKLGKSIMAKLALKGGSKIAGAATGAGAGATLCAWAGPFAAGCAVVGAAAAWVGTDMAVNKLAEFFNRDEFEAELREIIEEDMAKRRDLWLAAFERKARTIRHQSDTRVQDFTIDQMRERSREDVCRQASQFVGAYQTMRNDIRERDHQQKKSFRDSVEAARSDPALRGLAQEIFEAIDGDRDLRITAIVLSGTLSSELQFAGTIWGTLDIDGETFDLVFKNQKNMPFRTFRDVSLLKSESDELEVSLSLKLDHWGPNPKVDGSRSANLLNYVDNTGSGLRRTARLPLSMTGKSGPSGEIELNFHIVGERFPALQSVPKRCQEFMDAAGR